jgi:hypothetical protein
MKFSRPVLALLFLVFAVAYLAAALTLKGRLS